MDASEPLLPLTSPVVLPSGRRAVSETQIMFLKGIACPIHFIVSILCILFPGFYFYDYIPDDVQGRSVLAFCMHSAGLTSAVGGLGSEIGFYDIWLQHPGRTLCTTAFFWTAVLLYEAAAIDSQQPPWPFSAVRFMFAVSLAQSVLWTFGAIVALH